MEYHVEVVVYHNNGRTEIRSIRESPSPILALSQMLRESEKEIGGNEITAEVRQSPIWGFKHHVK